MARHRPLSHEYLSEALARAKKALPHAQYAVLHNAARNVAGGRARHRPGQPDPAAALEEALCKLSPEECEAMMGRVAAKRTAAASTVEKIDPTPEVEMTGGPADVLFVTASPTAIDVARAEPLTGDNGRVFREVYLKALGMDRSDVAIVHAVPVNVGPREPTEAEIDTWSTWLALQIKKADPIHIVALGGCAELAVMKAWGEVDETVPHPAALRIRPAREAQTIRKLLRVRKSLTSPFDWGGIDTDPGLTASSETAQTLTKSDKPGNAREVSIAKADAARQIIYAAVLDPYQVDSEDDWVPVSHVEKTAHDWMSKSRIVGLNHKKQANAHPVESWIVPYPSDDDYRKALRNEPHRAYRMPFGKEMVHSGTWILGTKLGDSEWSQFLKGEIDAYSVGGTGYRTPVSESTMPKVEFIELAEAQVKTARP